MSLRVVQMTLCEDVEMPTPEHPVAVRPTSTFHVAALPGRVEIGVVLILQGAPNTEVKYALPVREDSGFRGLPTLWAQRLDADGMARCAIRTHPVVGAFRDYELWCMDFTNGGMGVVLAQRPFTVAPLNKATR